MSYSRAAGTAVVQPGFPREHLAGLELTKSAADTLAIAAGEARDASNTADMVLSSAFTKDANSTWAVGSGNGGLAASATYSANTLYYVWLIRRSDTGVVDVLIDDDPAAPEYPTGYDQSRFIGYFFTDASSDVAVDGVVSAGLRRKEYVSPETTITSLSTTTLGHGLGVIPKIVQAFLVCKTADQGYAVGDVIPVPVGPFNSTQNRGMCMVVDETNIRFFQGSTSGFVFSTGRYSDGGADNLTNSRWKILIRAWS